MKILPFEKHYSEQWDDFVEACPMATFMHAQLFLSYHKKRFQDQSIIITDNEDKWLGVMPAASSLSDPNEIVSHPGITYGGILHKGKLLGSSMIEALDQVCAFYSDKGYKTLAYKAVPYIYHRTPSSDDLYALFRCEASLYRRDLSCSIDLEAPLPLSNKALSTMRRRFRKAEDYNVRIDTDQENLKQLWNVLTNNLKEKYGTQPVHSYAEISDLLRRFPNNIKVVTAKQGDQVIAGSILFLTPSVCHTQYLVVTQGGATLFALDYLINYCIEFAKENKIRYFDFGISNEQQGKYLNQGLYTSKAKHGGGGVTYDFYRITFRRNAHVTK